MKCYGMTICLKDDPELVEKYKEYHRHPWPETVNSLVRVGITDMKIFLIGRRMFMYMTTTDDFDPAVDFPRYMEDPKAKEWDELMRTFQERAPEAEGGEWWALMGQVFDLQLHIPRS